MKKFKIDNNVEKKDPSKYKDFGKLVTNYESTLNRLHKKPLYKDPKAFLFLVMIILVAYLVFEAAEEDRQNDVSPEIQQMDSVSTDMPK
ncbi:MAG: hypothetical protein P8L71_11075 [Flavobacteriales bacterium]|nr:hypothetical protein [Flavobacteriales bacterium]